MVCGKLHNERSRIAGEHLSLLKHDTGDDDCCNTDEVCGGCNPGRTAEDSTCYHGDERNLSAAGDKGCGHDSHTSVSFVFDSTGSHDTGNAAAYTYQHRNEGLTGKTELSEDSVHYECDTSHVTAGLKECEEKEEYQHLRYKSENCTNTGYDTIKDKTVEPIGCAFDCVTDENGDTGNPYTVISGIGICAVILNKCVNSICKISACCFNIFCSKCFFIFYSVCNCISFGEHCSEFGKLCSSCINAECFGFGINSIFDIGCIGAVFLSLFNECFNDSGGITVFVSSFFVSACAYSEEVPAVAEETVVSPVCCGSSDCYHCDVVNQEHYNCENRKTEDSVCNDLIDLIGNGKLTLVLLLEAVLNNGSDVDVTLVGDDALAVVVHFLFGSSDILLNVFSLVSGNVELFKNLIITLKNLDGVPSLLLLGDIVENSFFNMSDSVFNAAAEAVLGDHGNLGLSSIDSLFGSLVDSRALQSGYLNDLAAKLLGKLIGVDLVAVLADNVHHVDSAYNGDSKLNQLSGEVKVTLQVSTVNNIEDSVGALGDEVVSCNYFFKGVRGKRVDTGKVSDNNVLMTLEFSLFLFNCYAGPVTYELV